jgi:hypothetical protein
VGSKAAGGDAHISANRQTGLLCHNESLHNDPRPDFEQTHTYEVQHPNSRPGHIRLKPELSVKEKEHAEDQQDESSNDECTKNQNIIHSLVGKNQRKPTW